MGILGIAGMLLLGFWFLVAVARMLQAQSMRTKPEFVGGERTMWALFLAGAGLVALDYLVR